jgi:hypothetical protein
MNLDINLYVKLILLVGLSFPAQRAFSTQISKVDRKAFASSLKNEKITDSSVIVTIDRFCQLGQTFLTQDIALAPKKSTFSKEESHSVKLSEFLTLDELEDIAFLDDCVVTVTKDVRIEVLETTNDPEIPKQDHLSAIQYDKNFKFFFEGKIKKDSIIAVIDNGVDIRH